jgi:hypothetical protein
MLKASSGMLETSSKMLEASPLIIGASYWRQVAISGLLVDLP